MNTTRRRFLLGASALAVAPLLPSINPAAVPVAALPARKFMIRMHFPDDQVLVRWVTIPNPCDYAAAST